jgi:hypothetical protein
MTKHNPVLTTTPRALFFGFPDCGAVGTALAFRLSATQTPATGSNESPPLHPMSGISVRPPARGGEAWVTNHYICHIWGDLRTAETSVEARLRGGEETKLEWGTIEFAAPHRLFHRHCYQCHHKFLCWRDLSRA